MAATLYGVYKVRSVDFAERDTPFRCVANRVQLNGVTLHYCRYDAGARIAFPGADGYRQFVCLAGSGEVRTAEGGVGLDPQISGIVPPGLEMSATYGARYKQLVLQFDERALLHKAELITGKDFSGSVTLPTLEPLQTDQLQRLKLIALSLALQFSGEGPISNVVTSELSQALASAFLTENPHSFPAFAKVQTRPAGDRDVARLEDYIQAHWDQPLTIEAVAQACGLSVRSVFERFRQHRGVSPMSYIRDVRLSHANGILAQSKGAASVIDVAMACGFASFGHFARRYREKFGELPSQTLARSRSQPTLRAIPEAVTSDSLKTGVKP